MTAKVESYAGSTYPEHPRAFEWEGQHYEVRDVIHRRREPEGVGFLVRCTAEDALFDLFYLIKADQWRIQPKGSVITEEEPRLKPNYQGD